jgi:hypothetical protein
MKTIPNYHPPQDYRRPTKTQEKVYVPVNDYPEINFSEITNPLTFLTKFPFLSRSGFCQTMSCSYAFQAAVKSDIHLTLPNLLHV